MTHNELKKGMRVMMPGLFQRGPRFGVMMDNLKGVTRLVHIEESNGHYPDMGSVYVWDIHEVETVDGWVTIDVSPGHAKKQVNVQAIDKAFGW